MRNSLLTLHRWMALVTSLVLIVTAVSGGILVFEGAIDRGLHPELWRVHGGSHGTLPLDSLAARVTKLFPDAKVGGISMSAAPDRAWVVNAGALSVFVNPWDGQITGTRSTAEQQTTLARRLHVLHVNFFGSKIGSEIVAIVTAVSLLMVLTGLVLWWRDKQVKVNTAASWKRVNFDLHHTLGVLASLVLVVITGSAMLIHYDGLSKAVQKLDSAPAPAPVVQPASSPGASMVSLDAAVQAARTALTGADVMFVSFGGAPKNPIVVAMRFPEDHTPGGRSRVFVDRYTSTVLRTISTREAELGTRINNLKRSLHTGDVMGKPTEAIWLLAALIMAVQAITGLLMWWNGRAARVASARRAAA